MLETVLEHGRAGAAFDLDGPLATLSPDPEYHFWGNGSDGGPKRHNAVKAFYEGLVASGGAYFESHKPRIDDNVVTESILRQPLS
jgi:hypothetical protein